MKVIKKIILAVILLLISPTINYGLWSNVSWAGIANTVHNLSTSGPGIKATNETEICIFCHTPHNANPAVPLWNHEMSGASYTLYDSEYLQRAGYEAVTNVGNRSKLCLSCHDGTVAIGSVYNLGGSPATITLVGGVTTLPITSTAYIDTNLTDDHPVAIKYDTGITINFGSGTKTMELNATAPPINPSPYEGVKLYPGPTSGYGYVECTSCHDPHVETMKFLVIWNINLATTIRDICTTCHTKNNWTGSAHQTSTTIIDNPVTETQPIPGSTVADAACMACHKTHGGSGVPYLNRKAEENTCSYGTSTSCHGSNGGAKDIESIFGKSYTHPTTSISGIHTNLDVLAPTDLFGSNRHAECYDCHNPHDVTSSDKVGSVTGVTSGGGTGSGASTYPAQFEYQVCYKCHSSWGGQVISPDIGDRLYSGNTSYHPVEAAGTNSGIRSGAFVSSWSYASIVKCTDCHGNDNATQPQGLHGSNYNNILLKDYSLPPWTTGIMPSTEICFKCHDYTTYVTDGSSTNTRFWRTSGNNRNLHYRHVSRGWSGSGGNKKLTCYACHKSHGKSNKVHLMRDSTVDDNNNSVTINFTHNSGGGSCSPTGSSCHSSRNYAHKY